MPLETGCVKHKRSGRKKGVGNKSTNALRAMIAGALQDVGGREYLAKQAIENPTAFMQILSKTLPKEIVQDINLSQTTVKEVNNGWLDDVTGKSNAIDTIYIEGKVNESKPN